MPKEVEELLCCWAGRFGKSDAGAIWKIIPHCLMWCIWCERNARTFSGEEKSTPALKFSFLQTLFKGTVYLLRSFVFLVLLPVYSTPSILLQN